MFQQWAQSVHADIEVCAIQLPGREERFGEALLDTFSAVAAQAAVAIRPYLDRPYALFGHSLGALLAHDIAGQLESEGLPVPIHVFVSGCRAPHLPDLDAPMHSLPEREFAEQLRQFEGTPDEILNDAALMAHLLPMLRADFAVYESFCYRPRGPLECPITAFSGTNDRHVSEGAMQAWQQHTRHAMTLLRFRGGHFFLHEHLTPITRAISETLVPSIGAPCHLLET
ncbi:thioesterase [Burkholderia sp. Ac-20345]|nr:thioesterase [Burkholderia sp. Ac-20345]